MKKHILLFSAILALASLTYCHKESSGPDATQSNPEVKTNDVAAGERDFCHNGVVISGGFGVTVCGALSPNPNGQNNCTYCSTQYGVYVVDTNDPVTLPMLSTCFSVKNTTSTARSVTFLIEGNMKSCGNTYSFAPGQTRKFCIQKSGTCCRVIPDWTPCASEG